MFCAITCKSAKLSVQFSQHLLFLPDSAISDVFVNILVCYIKKSSGQYLSLIYDESLICRSLNSNSGQFSGSTTFIFVRVENHVCLSHGVHVIGVT
jgi:hypothetical protein